MAPHPLQKTILRLFLFFALCLIGLMLIVSQYYASQLTAQHRGEHAYQILHQLDKLSIALQNVQGLPFCARTGNPIFRSPTESAESFATLHQRLQSLMHHRPEQIQLLSSLTARWDSWQKQFVHPLEIRCTAPLGGPRLTPEEFTAIAVLGNNLRTSIQQTILQLETSERAELHTQLSESARLRSQTSTLWIVFGTLTALLALTSLLYLLHLHKRQWRLHTSLRAEANERDEVQQRMARSEAHLRSIMDNMMDGLVTLDIEGHIHSVNPAAARMFGFAPEDLIGQHIHRILPDQWHMPVPATTSSAIPPHPLPSGSLLEAQGVRKNGSHLPVELAITAMPLASQPLFTAVIRDITERKLAQEQITRFKGALDNTLDMIFMFNPNTLRFIYLNRGMVSNLGYSGHDLMLMRACDISPSQSEAVFRSLVAPLLRGEKDWLSYETEFHRANGSEVPVEVSLQLVHEKDGSTLFVAIARDLTERRRIDKMKSEFISTVSHELRTPLTSIRGSLGLLMGSMADSLPAPTKRMLEIAFNNAERLVRLINDILDMEKIESGKMRMEPVLLDLNALIEAAVEDTKAYAAEFQVTYVIEPCSPSPQVIADRDRLTQVMTNLLSNAAKFSPPKHTVIVRVTDYSGMVRVSVIDRGPGIPEAFQSRIFQKFSQADASDTRQKGGTGLGLSISKALIERMQGAIGFHSQPNQETVFWFELPIWKAPCLESAHTPDNAHILVCEDDPDVATVLRMMLMEAGYNVDVVHSAEAAKQQLESRRYAAITMDIQLPGMDGMTLIRELYANSHHDTPPILVISANANQAQAEMNGGHALLDWMEKPIDQKRMLAALHRLHTHNHSKPVVLHVEDDPDIRNILLTLLGDQAEIIGAASLAEARQALVERAFDLIIIDLGLPDGSGADVLQACSDKNVSTPVMIFSAIEASEAVLSKVKAALVKSRTSNAQLLDTIRRLASRI